MALASFKRRISAHSRIFDPRVVQTATGRTLLFPGLEREEIIFV